MIDGKHQRYTCTPVLQFMLGAPYSAKFFVFLFTNRDGIN